ncbi:Vacuolar transporter chaperone 1 [Smittium mucronatum]|uniref:Vacuolar transporter chaperone 1 n=1 Tax=Smittium mucronatum TaxID=133383 RepID=A0A1R0H7N1_9FUNG|nr:Vacuolar transporter chaperone 1 [Smittium mucronatum]
MPKFQNNANIIATQGNTLIPDPPVSTETAPLLSGKRPASTTTSRQIDPLNAAESQPSKPPLTKKKLAIPVRVEPKVFFANERTFLSWLNFSILLGTISLGLVNFGEGNIRIAGFAFTSLSILTMIYSLYMYQKRASMILARDPGPYGNFPFLVLSLSLYFISNSFILFTRPYLPKFLFVSPYGMTFCVDF